MKMKKKKKKFGRVCCRDRDTQEALRIRRPYRPQSLSYSDKMTRFMDNSFYLCNNRDHRFHCLVVIFLY